MDNKFFIKTGFFLFVLLCSSVKADAQINLGNILSGLTGNKTESSVKSSSGGLLSGLTSIFSSSKQASKDNIVGVWEYSEPAIVFDSNNLLAKAGASFASSKLEDKLQEQLSRFGINPGSLTINFKNDGSFTETFNGKSLSGKWEIIDSKLYLTFGTKKIYVSTQLESNKLMFVTDATKLLELVKTISSKATNSNFQTISSLLQSVDGMQVGLTLVKKQ